MRVTEERKQAEESASMALPAYSTTAGEGLARRRSSGQDVGAAVERAAEHMRRAWEKWSRLSLGFSDRMSELEYLQRLRNIVGDAYARLDDDVRTREVRIAEQLRIGGSVTTGDRGSSVVYSAQGHPPAVEPLIEQAGQPLLVSPPLAPAPPEATETPIAVAS